MPTKLQLYRGFEAALLSLERAERQGIFRLENLDAFKVSLEQTRPEANGELVQTLQDYEEEILPRHAWYLCRAYGAQFD